MQSRDGDDSALLAILTGSLMLVGGLGLWSSWLLEKGGRLANLLPLPFRLAVREIGRFNSRNGSIVAAITAAMTLTVLTATIFRCVLELQESQGVLLRDDQLLVVGPEAETVAGNIERIQSTLAKSDLSVAKIGGEYLIVEPDVDGKRPLNIAIGQRETLVALGIAESDVQAALDAINEDLCVALLEGKQELKIMRPAGSELVFEAELPAFRVDSLPGPIRGIGYVVSPRLASQYGWMPQPSLFDRQGDLPWLLRFQQPVDVELEEESVELASSALQTSIETRSMQRLDQTFYWYLLAGALLIGAALVFIATALSHSEAKHDQRILTLVGASPAVHRGQTAARAAYLTLIGCLLAIPAGLLPAYGVAAATPLLEFHAPWVQLIAGAVAIPWITFIGAFAIVSTLPSKVTAKA